MAALISLTYTIDDGINYDGIYLQRGQALVSNLSCYFHDATCPSPVTTDALAHAYGENSLGRFSLPLDCANFSDADSVIHSRENLRYYCRRNTATQEFAYRFNEYNPNDTARTYPHFTDRVLTASSGRCNEYDCVSASQPVYIGDSAFGGSNRIVRAFNYISAVNYTYTNGTHHGSILIPTSALGYDGTTYIYRGPEAPVNATQYAFGDRGLWVWAFKNFGNHLPDRGLKFYECPVSLSKVTNVRDSRHEIPNSVARQAVASIALQGQFKMTNRVPDWTQWQWYAYR